MTPSADLRDWQSAGKTLILAVERFSIAIRAAVKL